MGLVDYRVDGQVAVITLNDGENRFNPRFLEAFLDVLDAVERDTDAVSVVMTSAHEKIFSNGIDLDWLMPVYKRQDFETARNFFLLQNRLFERILTYPLITIAAISGHAFAGGAILCCAYDFRFMRSDRGFFCFPEVDLGIPFLPGMNALLKKAMPMYMVEEMELTGIRLTAADCQTHHIVKKALPREELMPEAMAFARSLNKRRPVVAELKKRLHQPIVQIFAVEDPPYIEMGKIHFG